MTPITSFLIKALKSISYIILVKTYRFKSGLLFTLSMSKIPLLFTLG